MSKKRNEEEPPPEAAPPENETASEPDASPVEAPATVKPPKGEVPAEPPVGSVERTAIVRMLRGKPGPLATGTYTIETDNGEDGGPREHVVRVRGTLTLANLILADLAGQARWPVLILRN